MSRPSILSTATGAFTIISGFTVIPAKAGIQKRQRALISFTNWLFLKGTVLPQLTLWWVFISALLCATNTVLHAAAEPISDNSFLIEEAYNQEPGVVQHINTFFYDWRAEAWEFTFTQEWPFLSQRHQLSYVVPVSHLEAPDSRTGMSDVLLNYRWQLLQADIVAIAPRLTLLLPTGKEESGFGTGSVGYQVNLPFSVVINERVVTHWNLGATIIPDEKNAAGESGSTTHYNYGFSFVYLLSPVFNLLFEGVGESVEGVGTGSERENIFLLNPGVRWAFNFASGLQIVPGLAFPFRLDSTEDEYGIFAYLSFEHPF